MTPSLPSPRVDAADGQRRWLELAALVAILVVAALTRLPGLDARGQWDADQGSDMRVLAALVGQGEVPLLGPMTSVGTFHHGALYYWLLAPAALVSGADPVAVTVEIALLGIAAVAATWWLGRLVGGPIAALVAGMLLAISPAAISESTFIWNPNPIPLFAALAAVGVVRARRTDRVRWWLLAALGTMATMQLHWLGAVLVVPVAGAWAVEVRRARRQGRTLGPLLRAGLGGIAILAAGYLPLAIHEAATGAPELRAIVAYAAGGGGSGQPGLLTRLVLVAVRSLTWPVAGLVTDRLILSLLALVGVVVLATVATVLASRAEKASGGEGGSRGLAVARGAGPSQADALARGAGPSQVDALARGAGPSQVDAEACAWGLRWLVASLLTSVVALAVLAPSLAVIVPGLPNDHYHAFLDPIVIVLVGAGAARMAGLARQSRGPRRVVGPTLAGALTVLLAGIAVTAWPPPVSPDGGWRLADAAAAHAIEVADAGWPSAEPRLLVGLPAFKSDAALRFPLERRGETLEAARPITPTPGALDTGVLTIVCDPLFDEVTGFPCGGPAEERLLADAYPPGTLQLADRFRAGPRRIISVYGPSRLAAATRSH